MKKISGDMNPADLMTKYLTGGRTAEITKGLGFVVAVGRSDVVDKA